MINIDINYSSNASEVIFEISKVESEELIKEQDFAFMKKRYEEGINELLEDAQRRHVHCCLYRPILLNRPFL